jgi:CRP/FNR family transcriptional regulator, cyclic AMP receptor protein
MLYWVFFLSLIMHFSQLKQAWQHEPILQHLALEQYQDQLKITRFSTEQQLLLNEQDVHFLIQGQIKIGYLRVDGKLQVYQYLQSSTLFNVVACVEKKPLYYHYFAMQAGQILHIPQHIFLQQLQQNTHLQAAVFKLFSARLWQSFEQQRYHVAADLKQHIAYQLLRLAEMTTRQNYIDISQQQFADLLQISRQTLHKQLIPFLQFGLIEWRYHQVRLLNVTQLKAWAML